MKTKLLMFLFLGIFLMSFASALEWDNLKVESDIIDAVPEPLEEYPVIEIKNTFGLGKTLFKGYIYNHTNYCGQDCSSDLEIELTEEEQLIQDIRFERLDDNGEWVDGKVRKYQIYYWGQIEEVEYICNETSCYENVYYVPGWEKYKVGQLMPAGNYSIKLSADKDPSKTIDWIIKTNGIWIDDWAVWGNISLGDDAEVILNEPAEEVRYSSSVNFNATANVTGGAGIVNLTLWNNNSGTFEIVNTTTYSDYVFDEIDDSSINTGLWETTSSDGSGYIATQTYTETNDYLEERLDIQDVSGSSAKIQSIGLNYSDIDYELRLRTSIVAYSSFNDGGGFSISTTLRVFGNTIATVTKSSGSGSVSSNDVWIIRKNGSNFDVYNDGIYQETITPTENDIYLLTSGYDNQNRPRYGYGRFYYVYVSSPPSVEYVWNNEVTNPIIWNVQACDTDGDCGFAVQNKTLIEDFTPPTVIATEPSGTFTFLNSGDNLTLEYSINDTNIGSCWYEYAGVNTSLDCGETELNFSSDLDYNTITVYANDSIGNLNFDSTSWDFIIGYSNLVYNELAIEASSQFFSIDFNYQSSDWSSVSALLSYHNVNYTAILSGVGDDITVSRTVSTPLVDDAENISFYWVLSLTNTTGTYRFKTNTLNQTVSGVTFSLCNYSQSPQLFFKTYSTTDPSTQVNSAFYSSWTIYDANGTGFISISDGYSDTTGMNSSWGFCIEPNNTAYTVSVDIKVDAPDYTPTYHYIVDTDYTSVTENISLYLLNDSEATLTKLQLVDRDYEPYPNAYITIQYYDDATSTYYNVGMARTDEDGEDLAYLVWYEAFYKFIIVSDGSVIATSGPKKISGTPQQFIVGQGIQSTYEKLKNIDYDLTFNNVTDNFILTYVDTTGAASSYCLRVVKKSVVNETTICNTCETSTSATLFCNIGAYGNGTFVGQFYATGSPAYYIDILQKIQGAQNELYNLIGNDDGTGLAIIIAGIVLTLFLITPALGVLGALLGMFLAVALGFQPLDLVVYVGITIIGIAVMVVSSRR